MYFLSQPHSILLLQVTHSCPPASSTGTTRAEMPPDNAVKGRVVSALQRKLCSLEEPTAKDSHHIMWLLKRMFEAFSTAATTRPWVCSLRLHDAHFMWTKFCTATIVHIIPNLLLASITWLINSCLKARRRRNQLKTLVLPNISCHYPERPRANNQWATTSPKWWPRLIIACSMLNSRQNNEIKETCLACLASRHSLGSRSSRCQTSLYVYTTSNDNIPMERKKSDNEI